MLIDMHVHCRRAYLPFVQSRKTKSFTTPDELLRMMDAARIDKAVLLPLMSPECRWSYVTPEETLEIAALHPGRFMPFCNLDARMVGNSPKADFLPILQYYKDAGCKGVGEYTANLPFDDPLTLNLFRQIAEVGLPLLFHIGPTRGNCYGCYDEKGLPRLEKALKAVPGLNLIGHSQPFWAEIGQVTEETRKGYPKGKIKPGRLVTLMRRYPNLWGDLSAGSGHNAISRDPKFGCKFLEEFQDRLFFGTDICACGQVLPQVPYFRKLKSKTLISPEAFEKITWKNANRLLGLGLSDTPPSEIKPQPAVEGMY